MHHNFLLIGLLILGCSTDDSSPAPQPQQSNLPEQTTGSSPTADDQTEASATTPSEDETETSEDENDTRPQVADDMETEDPPTEVPSETPDNEIPTDDDTSEEADDGVGRPHDDVPLDEDQDIPAAADPTPDDEPTDDDMSDDQPTPDQPGPEQPENEPTEPEEPTEPDQPKETATAKFQREVIDAHCTGCHSGANPAASLDLSDLEIYVKTAPNRLINPGNPARSGLYVIVSQGAMPPTGPLDENVMAKIKTWIENLDAGDNTDGPVISPGN